MTDGGNLVLTLGERRTLEEENPKIHEMIGRLVGGQELIKGILRYALVIPDGEVGYAREIPSVSRRLELVAEMRQQSSKLATKSLARTPNRFDETRYQKVRKVVVAQLSSELRQHYPCDLMPPDAIPMAPSLTIYDAPLWCISLISSKMHTSWVAAVCGKLETRYRYSNVIGWNTFPVPKLTQQSKADLIRCAEDILLAREAHFPATIAELYDPESMPEDLQRAHESNDEVLERIYIGRRFRNDTERLEKLFELYTKMTVAKSKAH